MSTLLRLLPVAAPYKKTFFIAIVFLMLFTLLDTAIIPVILSSLLYLIIGKEMQGADGGALKISGKHYTEYLSDILDAGGDKVSLLIGLSVVCIIIVLFKCGAQAAEKYLMQKFSYQIAKDLREKIFNHILRLSPAQYEGEGTGAMLSRVTNDVWVLQDTFGTQLSELLKAPLSIIIALTLMFVLNWKLMLAVICLAPIIAFIVSFVGKKTKKLTIEIQRRYADLSAYIAELIGSVRVIQSFTREDVEKEEMARLNRRFYSEGLRFVFMHETLAPTTEFIALTGMLIGVVLGGIQVINGQMHGEQFILFFVLAQRASSQFTKLALINQLVQRASGATQRIYDMVDVEPAIKDAPDAVSLGSVDGKVAFNKVRFSYDGQNDVLSGVDFVASPGEVIALVGASGAGKSTLVNLIPRFYDTTAGAITIDSIDIRKIKVRDLRSNVGVVPQETTLFSGTIADNIRYARIDASDMEVVDAAKAANALEFIDRLPEGFATLVGERGARLSGGQRQRIAIARALLKDPGILILDEATSSLDTESEHLVQQALETLMEGRTTFVIAHRLSTVRHADRILVMASGTIEEVGTHDELLAIDGIYRRLYEMQFVTRQDSQNKEKRGAHDADMEEAVDPQAN